MKHLTIISFATLLFSLTACFGGGPSEAEVSDAIKRSALKEIEASMSIIPNNSIISAQVEKQKTAIQNMKLSVGDISEGENDTYIADVTVENDGRMMQQKVHLKQGENGWAILN